MPGLFVSPSSEARQRWAWAQIQPHVRQTGMLVLASSRLAADDFLRARASAGDPPGLLGIHRYSVSQFAAALAASELAARQRSAASRLAREALAARAVFASRRTRSLAYFSAIADTPGFPRAVAATLDELRLAGVAPAQLAPAAGAGEDLARLLTHYLEEMDRHRLADLAMIYEFATRELRPAPMPALWLDLRPRSLAERRFLERLAGLTPSLSATALAADHETVAWLQGLAPRVEAPSLSPTTSLDRIRQRLFSYEELTPAPSDSTFDFFSAGTEALECAEIARRIRKLAAAGTPFDRVAVLLRNVDLYTPLLEDALRRARIPAYFTGGALRPDPAGRAFLALLECALEDLPATRFAEYLSLGQVPMGDAAPPDAWTPAADELTRTPFTGEETGAAEAGGSTPVEAPWAWERLLVDAAVVGGYDRWARRLRGLEAELRAQAAEIPEETPRRLALERQLERLRSLESFCLPLIERLHGLPRHAPWNEWLAALRALALAALKNPHTVLPLLDELEVMGDLGPVSLEEVAAVLRQRLRFLRVLPPDRRYGRVFVASLDETEIRSFAVVFLPGLAEGQFPRKPFEDPLLLDAARQRISAALATQPDRLFTERLRLHQAASAAERCLVVCYPRIDLATSRPRVPSFYALEVLRAAEGQLPDLRVLEKRAAAAATTRLGWPAPVDPGEALDETEHDLAVLGPLMARPEQARGRARYMLRANPHLARSLRARGRRWRSAWHDADGLVLAEDAGALAPFLPAASTYSASSLQTFADCPYQFFLHAIQQLRPREESAPLSQMDPLTRGSLIHQVQFRFLSRLAADGQLPLHPLRLQEWYDPLDATLDEVAREYAEELAPAIPRVWRNEVEAIRADLRAWLRDSALHAHPWKPLHFEYSFGLTRQGRDADAASAAEPVTLLDGALRLCGSVDVVESDGQKLRVVDYKTGKPPETAPTGIGGGQVLQPALYALAAEQLLKLPAESGLLYFCTQRGEYRRVEIPLTDRVRASVRRAVEVIGEAIGQGFLPAAPRKGACGRCDYRPVCGPYEEIRARRKRRDRLAALDSLRNLP